MKPMNEESVNNYLEVYQNYVHQGLVERKNKHQRPNDVTTLLVEMTGELGETCNAYKHAYLWPDRADADSERVHLREELGDLTWYLVAVADSLHVSIEDLMKENMLKLDRRYHKEDKHND